MEDFLESYIQESELSMANVRDLVDDYSLISFYIGSELELNTRYSSPLREGDENPSFSMFYGYGEGADTSKLFFKDHAEIGSGDVFDFLKIFLNTESINKVLEQINFDLGLGLGLKKALVNTNLKPTLIKKIPLIKERPKIEVVNQEPTKEYMDYWWKKYETTEKFTKMYDTSCVRDIHYKYSDRTSIICPRTLSIGYAIGKYHKLYHPYEVKEYKFRNDYPSNYIEGHLQLDWSRNDLLVITKSTKECIVSRQHWDIQAVSGKSETTMIPSHMMFRYLAHFKRVVLWLDPDRAGIESTEKYLHLYPNLEVATVPEDIKEKDLTDIFEAKRKKATSEIVSYALRSNF